MSFWFGFAIGVGLTAAGFLGWPKFIGWVDAETNAIKDKLK